MTRGGWGEWRGGEWGERCLAGRKGGEGREGQEGTTEDVDMDEGEGPT